MVDGSERKNNFWLHVDENIVVFDGKLEILYLGLLTTAHGAV